MSIRVVQPGLMTTIQDLGRIGMQQYGVVVGGAMDTFAIRVANLLVANEPNAAAIEVTLMGPTLAFEHDCLIAICGADLSPRINGHAIPSDRPIWVRHGSLIEFGAPVRGCRAYLAVAGGIDVPLIMNSRSTYLRAEIGGFQGRPLQTGDLLDLLPASQKATDRQRQMSERATQQSVVIGRWFVGSDSDRSLNNPTIRIVEGSQFDWFTRESREAFLSEEFSVTNHSDRMGYRLAGPPLRLMESRELISEAVTAGTVQVPPEGQPIILMADRPTTGGYPKIAQVASVDIPILAQMKPGSRMRFQIIPLEQAQGLYRSREAMIQRMRCGIDLMND